MCGIAGIFQLPPAVAERSLVEAMSATLRHRGPDAAGIYCRGGVGLASRRLAIIDTSADANQPLANEDGSVVVVFNGAIYNFRELATELAARGHRFRTRCDTEVIVHAWEEHGPACVERFRGMFAFALWDAGREELFLARDRLGKKPLFYSVGRERLVFGSEIKALRRVPGIDLEVDLEALGEFAAYGASLGERTIHRGIRRLPPAHTLRISLAGQRLEPRIERYWRLAPRPDEETSEAEWLDRLDAAIAEAVRLRLVADVPLGAFLSGGIDSSLVVAHMAAQSTAGVRTFTMSFPGSSYDESAAALSVASHLGTEHVSRAVEPGSVDILETLVEVYDEPFGDESAIPTFFLSEIAAAEVKVALTGDGGDESFLGYRRYPWSRALGRLGGAAGRPGRAALGGLARLLPDSALTKRPLERASLEGFDLYNHAMGWSDELVGLLRPEVRGELAPPEEGRLAAIWRHWEGAGEAARFGLVDLETYLPDDVLVKVDRASMHHSLEARSPLLDHEVVELAARVPASVKLRGWTGKRILRQLLRRHLPDLAGGAADAPKRGFGVPLGDWFRGQLTGRLEEMVADRESAMWRFWDREALVWRLERHLVGRADLKAGLWRAFFFYHWARRHLA